MPLWEHLGWTVGHGRTAKTGKFDFSLPFDIFPLASNHLSLQLQALFRVYLPVPNEEFCSHFDRCLLGEGECSMFLDQMIFTSQTSLLQTCSRPLKTVMVVITLMMMIWPPSLSIPSSQSSSCSWSQYSPLQPDLVINDHHHHSSSSV